MEIATINGETGLCIRDGVQLAATLSILTDGEHIQAVYAVVNPDKLSSHEGRGGRQGHEGHEDLRR
jgi:hypothetical protein